jgi:hypothetical protein
MDRLRYEYISRLFSSHRWRSLPIHLFISRTGTSQPHNHNSHVRNRNYDHKQQRIQPVIARLLGVLFITPHSVLASDVGGVSATSNPVANSSGQATVNAYQVLTGNFINSAFTNGVQCQAETVTISPYIGRSKNIKLPFVTSYKEPVYDMRDIDGDGAPDNPGAILFEKDILTQQKDNFSLNYGATLQWSKPLDSKLQALCKEAASTEIALRKASLNLKILDYEISRLKHCGTLRKENIYFRKGTKYAVICEDVEVGEHPTSVPDHAHNLEQISKATSSETSAPLGVHVRKAPWASSSEGEVKPSSKSSSPEA